MTGTVPAFLIRIPGKLTAKMGTTDFNPMDILLFIFINTYFSPLIGDNAAMSRQNIPGCLLRVVKTVLPVPLQNGRHQKEKSPNPLQGISRAGKLPYWDW